MYEEKEQVKKEAAALIEVFHRFKHGIRRPDHVGGMKSGAMSVMGTVALYESKHKEGIRISDIGKLLRISNPTVTQFINSLEKTGWVERRMDANDRRSVQVFLTDVGRRHHQKFENHMNDLFEALVAHLGVEDSRELVRLMGKSFAFMENEAKKCFHVDKQDSP